MSTSNTLVGPPDRPLTLPKPNGWTPKHDQTDTICALLDKGRRHWSPSVALMATSSASRQAVDRMLTGRKHVPARSVDDVRAIIRWIFGGGPGDYEPDSPAKFDWRRILKTGAALERNYDSIADQMRASQETEV